MIQARQLLLNSSNIYATEQYDDIFHPSNDRGGALDNLMSDLMAKMNTEERKSPTSTPLPRVQKALSASCSACGKGISRSDEIVNMDSRVRRKCATEAIFYPIGH